MHTNDEKTDMILIYGESKKNTVLALRLYRQHYPARRASTDKIFKRLEMSLRENWPSNKKTRRNIATGEENEVLVTEAVETNPHIYVKEQLAKETGISQTSVN
ncbi:hypothetical protein ILUMI_08880 [Ignelater luminosus]|uniref:DUF4817 domain-containing protein n=1 Tax=Ignelater luminosus TaxID=2038154 RepID=A0A8K0DAF5_IGNLU|nr:hypothetical protein ILUMI_08880 [Ignelater luminosus]